MFVGKPEFPSEIIDRISGMLRGALGDFIFSKDVAILHREDWELRIMIPPDEPYPSFKEATIDRSRKSLTLAMVVKNEESRILDTLKSVASIVNHVAILDTGSTDHTVEVSQAYLESQNVAFTIKSAEFKDFAQARNDLKELIPSHIEWILMLDADEQICERDHQRLLELLKLPNDAWSLPRYNIFDLEKKNNLDLTPIVR